MKHRDERPDVSVVVPAYCESEQIDECLDRLGGWLDRAGLAWEIIVVDDGSGDATASIVRRRTIGDDRIRLVAYRPNRGKGFAVRTGLRSARGRRVLFTDADLSTPPEEIATALELLDAEEGQTVELKPVRFISGDEGGTVGQPELDQAHVKATVVRNARTRSITIFKKKRRKGYRRTKGHRQDFTHIRIEEIVAG